MKTNKFFLIYLAIIAIAVLLTTVCNGQTNTATDNLTIRNSMTFKGKVFNDIDQTVPSYLSNRVLGSNAAKTFMLDWFVSNDSVYRVTGEGAQFRFMLPQGVSYLSQLEDVSIPDTSTLSDGMQLFFNGTTRKWNASYWNGIVDITDLAQGIRYKNYNDIVITDSTLPPAAWVLAQIAAAAPTPYTAGKGIKFNGSIIQWADTLFTSTSMDGNNYAGSLSYWQLNSFNVNSLSGSLGNNTGIPIGASSTYGGFRFNDNFADRGMSSFYNFGTNNYGRFRVLNSTLEALYMNAGKQAGMYVFNNGTNNVVTSFFADSIRFRHSTTGKYQPSAESTTKYKVVLMDSTTGALVTTAPINIGSFYTGGNGIRVAGNKVSLKDTIDFPLDVVLRDTFANAIDRNPFIQYRIEDSIGGRYSSANLMLDKTGGLTTQFGIMDSVFTTASFGPVFGIRNRRQYDPGGENYPTDFVMQPYGPIYMIGQEAVVSGDIHQSFTTYGPKGVEMYGRSVVASGSDSVEVHGQGKVSIVTRFPSNPVKFLNSPYGTEYLPYGLVSTNKIGKRVMMLDSLTGDMVLVHPDSLGISSGGSSTLAGLTDVSPTGWADGKQLFYNGTTSKWEAGYWNGMLDIASATNGLRYTNPGSFVPTDSSLGTIGYNNTLYAPLSRNLTAGYGLVGGGTLGADRSFRVDSVDIPTKLFLSDRLAELAAQYTHAAGAVPFGTGTGLTSDAANLFWNNSTKRFGIGTNSPNAPLHVVGNSTLAGTSTITAVTTNTINGGGGNLTLTGNNQYFNVQGSVGGTFAIAINNAYTGTASHTWLGVTGTGFAPTSGSGNFAGLSVAPIINQTGTASGQTRGLHIAPTLTAVTGSYRGIDVDVPGTNHYGIYQSGANSRNYLQGRVGINNATPDASSILDIQSTDKGVLIPRMNTTQLLAIPTPATGLYVFNTDSSRFAVKVASGWKYMAFQDDVASSAAAPAGSNMQVQYNDVGTAAGATNVKIENNVLRLDEVTSTATPAAGGMKIYSKDVNGLPLMFVKDENGNEQALQTSLMFGKMPVWVSYASGTTAPIVFGGIISTNATMGTAAPATTNEFTKFQRKTYTTSTTVGNATGLRQAYTQFSPSTGGYFAHFKFGQTLTTSGEQKFVGMCQSMTLLAGAPSTLVNMIGMGVDDTDVGGNWFLMYNDASGTASKIDLGANAVRNTTHGYELNIYAPASGAGIYVQVKNIATGVEVYNGLLTTDIPATTTLVTWRAEIRTTTAASTNIHMAQTFIQPL